MELNAERVDVWAALMKDEPGELARMLSALSAAGADLAFVIGRRAPEAPGYGALFVTPLEGEAQLEAAHKLGFHLSPRVHSLRVEGENRAGVGAEITRKIADAGINVRGFSAAVVQGRFVAYVGFDSAAESEHALDVLQG